MELLEKKIGRLEKVILELAKWTNFDHELLQTLDFVKRPLAIDIQTSKDSNQQIRASSDTENDITGSSNAIKSKRMFAKKSTAGVRSSIAKNPNSASCSRRIYFPSKTKKSALEPHKDQGETIPIELKEEQDIQISIYSDLDPDCFVYLDESLTTVTNAHSSGADDDDANERVQIDPPNFNSDPDNGADEGSDFEYHPDYEEDSGGSVSSDTDTGEGAANIADTNGDELRIVNIKSISEQRKRKPGRPRLSQAKKSFPNPYVRLTRVNKQTLEEEYKITLPPRTGKPLGAPFIHKKYIKTGPYQCSMCPQIFKNRSKLDKHLRTFHKTKKTLKIYTCEYCQRTDLNKHKHFNHVRVHTGERPFLCSICGFATRTNQMLNSHLSTHSEKLLNCEHCKAQFKTVMTLKSHIKRIHNINNNLKRQCTICKAVFADSSSLKKHISDVHEDQRKLVCELCGQAFKRNSHLKKHIIRHENPNRRKRGQQKPMLKKPPGELPTNTNNNLDKRDVLETEIADPIQALNPSKSIAEEEKDSYSVESNDLNNQMKKVEETINPDTNLISDIGEKCETIDTAVLKEFRFELLN